MSKYIGQKFGYLTVIASFAHRTSGGNYKQKLKVRCSCGKEYDALVDHVTKSDHPKCKDCQKKVNEKASASGYKHPLYRTWFGMVSRCHMKTFASYKDYGARGITVCDRWRGARENGELGSIDGFYLFVEDMGERPSPKHSIDRINNDGNYEPGNCRWATSLEQQNNKRSNHRITARGVTKTLSEWGRVFGTGISWAANASKYNVPLEQAAELLIEKVEEGRIDWMKLFGIPKSEQVRHASGNRKNSYAMRKLPDVTDEMFDTWMKSILKDMQH